MKDHRQRTSAKMPFRINMFNLVCSHIKHTHFFYKLLCTFSFGFLINVIAIQQFLFCFLLLVLGGGGSGGVVLF